MVGTPPFIADISSRRQEIYTLSPRDADVRFGPVLQGFWRTSNWTYVRVEWKDGDILDLGVEHVLEDSHGHQAGLTKAEHFTWSPIGLLDVK